MAMTEEREARIRDAVAPGFRDRLLSKGAARAVIWTEGVLPDNAPRFPVRLSHDLLSYGYALLSDGLHVLEEGGDREAARLAFEHGAQAIEAVVAKGKRNRERDFHRFVMAAAYHLAGFSARAYSLIEDNLLEANLTLSERCVCLLMVRDLDALNRLVRDYKQSGAGSDGTLTERAAGSVGDDDAPDMDELLSITVEALTDGFMTALAEASLAFERGDDALLETARARLQNGMRISGDLHLVPQWWAHRLAVFLLWDLWESSFHQTLPRSPALLNETDWARYRRLFIASLYKRARAEIDLWPSQLPAAGRAVDLSDNLVVSLPTSAGKTRIAELCILACLASGRRVMFITPLRALSAQTEAGLEKTFAPLGKSVSSLYGSIGDAGIDRDFLRERDIIVATPEKLDFALRNDPDILNDVGLVVLDEGHMIGLTEREIRYEVQIQRLLKRADANQRRIVCLSAILPDGDKLEDFTGWITEDSEDGLIQKDWRPTRLRFGEVAWSNDHARLEFSVGEERPFVPRFLEAFVPPIGRRKKAFPNNQNELCLATGWKLVDDGQTVLIFCPLRKSVEPFAKLIMDLHKRGALSDLLDVERDVLDKALMIGREWYPADHPILQCLEIGVAIHHGALPTPFRREVEKLLRAGVLKVTISSPTLAQGLNLSATALIFQSLHRVRELIKVSEFRNVIGRAGRAFVDVEGSVLYPMFDNVDRRRRQWAELIADAGGKEMESGLLSLLRYLLKRMIKKHNFDNAAAMLEYIANSTNWAFPELDNEQADARAVSENTWDNYMSWLDTAILSLLGDQDIDEDAIETAIDAILSSSLWSRRLARQKDTAQKLLQAGLVARTKIIWAETTPVQRRAYFLSGVGTKTGKALDAQAERLNDLLFQVNGYILLDQPEDALAAITSFAEIVFDIPPFAPDKKPDNWQEILRAWISGAVLTDALEGQDSQSLNFIEDALVYRLAWAMEAVRVRWQATDEVVRDDLTYEDVELGVAAVAVETGTLNRSAGLLMKSGFAPRQAAQSVVDETEASFTTLGELRAWLRSDDVVQLSQNPDWPTAETHDLWIEFLASFKQANEKEWSEIKAELTIVWPGDPALGAGAPVRFENRENETLLLDADYTVIGRLDQPLLDEVYQGVLTGEIMDDLTRAQVTYIGPQL